MDGRGAWDPSRPNVGSHALPPKGGYPLGRLAFQAFGRSLTESDRSSAGITLNTRRTAGPTTRDEQEEKNLLLEKRGMCQHMRLVPGGSGNYEFTFATCPAGVEAGGSKLCLRQDCCRGLYVWAVLRDSNDVRNQGWGPLANCSSMRSCGCCRQPVRKTSTTRCALLRLGRGEGGAARRQPQGRQGPRRAGEGGRR